MPPAPDSNVAEAVLVRLAQARDKDAFAELVRRRQGWLRALLLRLCTSNDADDIAQATFLRAWRRLDNLRDPNAFGPWLRRMAVRLYLDSRARERLTENIDDDDGHVLQDTQPLAEEVAAARIDLDRAFAILSPGERLCITLNLGEGMSHGEIVDVTALPIGTVKSHIARGVRKIRRLMGAHYGRA